MSDTQTILKPEHYYHIYNHAVGNENLFDTEKDYIYFLVKFKKYIFPISELLTYCLMPNHFHLIIRLKSETEIKMFVNSNLKGQISKNSNPTGRVAPVGLEIDKALSQIFSNFFNTYAKHYNFLEKPNRYFVQTNFQEKRN